MKLIDCDKFVSASYCPEEDVVVVMFEGEGEESKELALFFPSRLVPTLIACLAINLGKLNQQPPPFRFGIRN